jgi:5-methylcytosine-specific restriction endonuclease McrA
MSRTIDHIISVRDRPDLYLDRSNCQLAHRKCNGAKWAGPALTNRTPTAVDW